MRDRNTGIDEFKLARVFGAVAAAVALYGILLVIAALLDAPLQTSATRFGSFTAVAEAAEPRPGSKTPAGRGVPFWRTREVPTAPADSDSPARDPERDSFWQRPGDANDGAQLAGELARAAGTL